MTLVRVFVAKLVVGLERISINFCAFFNVFTHVRLKLFAVIAGNVEQTHTRFFCFCRALQESLHRMQIPLSSSIVFAPRSLSFVHLASTTTDIGFVNLNLSAKDRSVPVLHREPDA